ncbi:heterokaryon incompatibility protein-domain-containing protein, partial [Cercophora newfieldiana]
MAFSQLPEYQYTRLEHEHIRMVTLHPGAPTDPLRISINTRYLHFCPAYTAVSYVWGSSERPHLIDAADTATGAIRVTENLRNLLLNIRPGPEEERIYVWADSICINQEDQKEKTEQVKLMGRIFARADKTIFYLGEEDEDSKMAFKTVKILNMMKGWPWPPGAPDIWRPFIRFLTRPWFYRTWIIQEVVVAK